MSPQGFKDRQRHHRPHPGSDLSALTEAMALTHPTCPHTHSVDEVAALLGCSPRTLRDRAAPRARNRIPSTKIGGELRFTDDQIAEIIHDGERRPAAPRRDSRRRS